MYVVESHDDFLRNTDDVVRVEEYDDDDDGQIHENCILELGYYDECVKHLNDNSSNTCSRTWSNTSSNTSSY